MKDTTTTYACMFLPFLNCVNMGQTWKVSRLHKSGLIIPHLKVNEAQMCVTMNDCPNVVALRMSGKLLEQVISSERSNEGERDPFIHQEESVSSTSRNSKIYPFAYSP